MSDYTTTPPPGAGGPPVSGARRDVLTGQHVLAGWWSRVFAQIIDGVIVGAGALVLLVAITAPFSIGFFASDTVGVVACSSAPFIGVLCASAFVALLYAPAMMARTNGKTLGRMVTGHPRRAGERPADRLRLRDAARGAS